MYIVSTETKAENRIPSLFDADVVSNDLSKSEVFFIAHFSLLKDCHFKERIYIEPSSQDR